MGRAFEHGDHICALYSGEKEHHRIAAAYVAEGLRRGERCLYVAGSVAALKRFRTVLRTTGIDAAAMVKRGALIEATNAQAHLAGGRFDSERMLQMLNDAVEDALNAGFQGLRTCGDMSWLLDQPEGAGQVLEYEALLNQFFRGVRAMGMCLFDRSRFPASQLDDALATHSSVALVGRQVMNPFYEDPRIALGRKSVPESVAGKLNVLGRL